ncbi:type VI secretion system ATPase TssH [Neptunicella marina]|uniref:Type VI secretion system ATPase TssH n=1 Tax=Neptunicella marina TaxID=2125989 RepID=A0A8J6IVV3_9ALTE|nr:type VI secretion system ATPase TssH [Neptunicella marina]MBC3766677.1 type VI secretion system ATPase TssH [Neptunicella marina]
MLNVDLKPLIKKLSSYTERSLEAAAGVCVSRGHYEVTIDHMLLVLLEDPSKDFQQILNYFGINLSHIQREINRAVEEIKGGNPGKPVFSPLLVEWIQEAWLLGSIEFGFANIRSGMLITTLLANSRRYGFGQYMDLLDKISADELRLHFNDIVAGSSETSSQLHSSSAPAGNGGSPTDNADSALARFAHNLTEAARNNEIDPIFCRDNEIRQMIDILGRRRKNNPIVVGEAGVGKSAVVEGLALKIANGDVPDFLKEVELVALDLQLLQAGASVKGEFENRLKQVMDEVKSSPKPIILFIDEVHTLIGAGGAAGTGDAANILKPALARGEMRTIAATTFSEYKKYIDKDPALARRFQNIKLDEPSAEQAITILRGLKDIYEKAHGVYVRDDAIESAAFMAERYITGRQLPDKAVDVLDTASARVKLSLSSKPAAIEDMQQQIAMFNRQKDAITRDIASAVITDDGQINELDEVINGIEQQLQITLEKWQQEQQLALKVLELRDQVKQAKAEQQDSSQLQQQLDDCVQELETLQAGTKLVHYETSPETVAQVISDWTGVPLGNMVRDESKRILEFATNMGTRVKGQNHAITSLDEGVRSAKAGLQNPDTPLGVFLFVGPSGVGKTEMALAIADELFGGERFMTTINMSEFQEKHSVSRLIGSPPGYVGYGEGGMLTEAVRQRPYSVVLLDEVEKADLEVMNLFYQVFDKGMLSDSEGRLVDFRNTIVILTSNLATDVITQMGAGDERPPVDVITSAIRPILSNHFKPALLARMQIVPFYPLVGDILKDIVVLKLNKVVKRLQASQDIVLEYSDAVVAQIAERCKEVETGARNIDHIINRTLLPEISTHILQMMHDDSQPQKLNIDIGKDGLFTYQFS